MGDGTARSGRLPCKQNNRWVRISISSTIMLSQLSRQSISMVMIRSAVRFCLKAPHIRVQLSWQSAWPGTRKPQVRALLLGPNQNLIFPQIFYILYIENIRGTLISEGPGRDSKSRGSAFDSYLWCQSNLIKGELHG